jgi:hypothetical protein
MKRTTPFGPDHAGRHTQVAVHPGMVVSHLSHGIGADAPARGGNIARDSSRGKHVNPVPVHPASHRVTGTNEGAPKITTLSSIPDASNPAALDPTTKGKTFAPVAASPGQRSRLGEVGPGQVSGGVNPAHDPALNAAKHAHAVGVGQMILDQAFANSAADDRRAHGRPTIKPTITVEK